MEMRQKCVHWETEKTFQELPKIKRERKYGMVHLGSVVIKDKENSENKAWMDSFKRKVLLL